MDVIHSEATADIGCANVALAFGTFIVRVVLVATFDTSNMAFFVVSVESPSVRASVGVVVEFVTVPKNPLPFVNAKLVTVPVLVPGGTANVASSLRNLVVPALEPGSGTKP